MKHKILIAATLCAAPLFAQHYKVEKTIPIGGTGGWDYATADSVGRRLYVSHGGEVIVVDLDSNAVVGRVTGMTRIHGIAIDRDANKGFISDGGSNQIFVFDLKSLQVTNKVAGGQNPDAIIYDPFSKKVFAFNGKSEDISVVDPASEKITATLPASGKPEFAVSDDNGNIYFNVEDKNDVGHIDIASMTVKQHWSIAPCDSPSGLAIDTHSNRLFSVCDGGKMAVLDPASGKVVATPAIGDGPDAAAFDAARKLIFSSNGQDGTLTVVKEQSANKYAVVQTLPTRKGARTMALDEKTHKLYLPTAEFGPAPAATAQNAHPRPSIKPDSFNLVVVSPE